MYPDKNVLLVGGAGVPNYGDELIVKNWVAWYDQRGTQSVTVSGSDARVLATVLSDYPHVRTSAQARYARFAEPPVAERDFYRCLEAGYRHLHDHAHDGSPLSREFLEADIVHVHGGGYLNSKWPTHAFLVGLAWAAAERTGSQLVGTGLGWGPLEATEPGQRTLLASAVSAFDFLEVRDAWSYSFLTSIAPAASIVFGLDDAFLVEVPVERHPGAALHVSLHANPDAQAVVDALDPAFVADFNAVYFWVCTAQDAEAYLMLAKRFPHAVPLSWRQLIDRVPMHDRSAMITARFHPHLIGARLGMRGYYRSGSSYYNVKHGSLVDLGSPFTSGDVTAASTWTDLAPAGGEPLNDRALVARKREIASSITV